MKYDLKLIMSTSDRYHHVLRAAIYLFNKNWSDKQPVEIVGYKKPDFELPPNFTFVSLGEQKGGPENFTTDLAPYFAKQPDWFIWMMDDTFIRSVNEGKVCMLYFLSCQEKCGKLNLTRATRIQDHTAYDTSGGRVLEATQTSMYRLATQPSIWNREYLLKYMIPGLSPWKFETQWAHNDGWRIFGLENEPLIHNEGVTKHDIYKLNLHGIPKEQILEMEDLGILNDTMTYERP